MTSTRDCTYEKQGGVQIFNIFRNHIIVMFVSNLLVDGPKTRCWVGLNRRWFAVIRDRLLEPNAERCCISPDKPRCKLEENPTEQYGSPRLSVVPQRIL